jgi:predicted acetyltransferase
MASDLAIVPATLADYPALQNLARFYVYDISRYCGGLPGWDCPEDGLYEAYDFRPYFETPDCFPFSLYAGEERAGFVVVKNVGTDGATLWNMEQFFVIAKFQRRGEGARLVQEVWTRFRGPWRIEVIPENAPALAFWRSVVERQSTGNYRCERKSVATPEGEAERIVFSFDS